jgi:hypothetical protein
MAAEKRWKVTCPYLMVRCPGAMVPNVRGRYQSHTLLGFYRDALLPPGVHPDDIARQAEDGRIEEVTINA